MNGLVKTSFNLNLTSLRVLGLYPQKYHSKLYLVFGYLLLFCSLLPDSIFGALYYVLDEELSLLDAGPNILVMVALLSFMPKLLPFIFSHEKIRDCVYYLEVFNVSLNGKQKEITDDSVWICQRNSRFFFFCTVVDNIMFVCRPFFIHQEKRGFLLDVWLPFDPTKSNVVFYSVYVFVALGVSYIVFANAAVDTLISGLAYHAAGQIKILKDNLQFLYEYAEEEAPRDKYEVIYRKLRECAQHHQHIIRFVKKIEDSFSWVLFSQFLGSTIMICISCLQLSLFKPGSNNFIIMAIYLNTVLVEIYFYCYYGTTLYEESKTLVTAAYLGRWYDYDLKSRKALILFMERAKIPMTVTAEKLLDLSLDTFTNVLKKSYSLLAVLENYSVQV